MTSKEVRDLDREAINGGSQKEAERDKEAEKRLSDATRMSLTIAAIEKQLYELPVRIAFGALATLAGRLIVASHSTNDNVRRNNRHVFVHTLDNIITMEEARVEREKQIKHSVERIILERQVADPARAINRKAVELEVRAAMRAREDTAEGTETGNA